MNTQIERPIDIRKLTVEEPSARREESFDPLEVIPNERWQAVAENLVRGGIGYDYIKKKAFSDLVWLKPEIKKPAGLRFSDFIIRDDVDVHYMQNREILKRMRPDFYVLLEDESPKMKDMKARLITTVNNRNTDHLESLACYHRLFPEDRETIEKSRNFIFESWHFFLKQSDHVLPSFKKIAANLRVLYPNRFQEIKLPDNFWRDSLAQIVHKSESTQDAELVDSAVNLRILAAKEVIVDKDGMHLVFPKDNKFETEKIPDLPEARRYR